MECENGPDEGVIVDIESAGSASICRRLSVVGLEDSCDVTAVSVVHDLHHPEDPFVEDRELKDCEAVPGYVMPVLGEVMHGFSDRDLRWGRELS